MFRFFLFLKKTKFWWWKPQKTVQKMQLSQDFQFVSFIYSFLPFLTPKLNFFQKQKNSGHLNLLWRIFFTSGVFENFEVDFWPLLKEKKGRSRSRFWREKIFSLKFFFLLNFIFYHPYEPTNFCSAGLMKIALIVTALVRDFIIYYRII